MPKAYLGLGSNVGNREAYLRAALKLIKANNSIKITKVSSLYQSDAVGYGPQRSFLNVVVEIETLLSPRQLLEACLSVERFFKRKRTVRWGPRKVDVDILLYGQVKMEEKKLVLPHPGILNRSFALVPLLEIAPGITLPNGSRVEDSFDAALSTGIERVGDLSI